MTALNSTIYLAPYDPDWPIQFSLHAKTIRDALAERVLLLEHVGSTSVPFLPAKPIIDMVLAVSNSADEASYVPQLEARGFEHRLLKAPNIPGIFMCFLPALKKSTMLMFRDWLRIHDDDRRLYEENPVSPHRPSSP